MKIANHPMRVVIFNGARINDKDVYIAQCLDKDICVQGFDIDEAFKNVCVSIALEGNHEYFDRIQPAPVKFVEMWDQARTIHPTSSFQPPVEIETRLND